MPQMSITGCTEHLGSGHENDWHIKLALDIFANWFIVGWPSGTTIKFGWWPETSSKHQWCRIISRITDEIPEKKISNEEIWSYFSWLSRCGCLLKQRGVAADTVINAWGFSIPVFPDI
jgi:hypothetical protein